MLLPDHSQMFSIVLCKLAGTDDPTYMSRQLLHEQTIIFVQSVARTVLLQKIIDALLAGRAWMGA